MLKHVKLGYHVQDRAQSSVTRHNGKLLRTFTTHVLKQTHHNAYECNPYKRTEAPCYGQMCHRRPHLIKLNHGREGDGGQSWLNFSAITSDIASVSIIYTASSKRQLHRNCLKVAMFRRTAKCSPTYRAAVCLGTVTPKDILLIATSRYLAFVYHNTEGKAFYNGYNVSV